MKAKLIILLALLSCTLANAQVVGEYKYIKLKAGGKTNYNLSGKPKSLYVEQTAIDGGSPLYYYGNDRYKIQRTDKTNAAIYRNDSIVAYSSGGIKVGDDMYTLKEGSRKEWKYLKDGEAVISGSLDSRDDGKFITIKYNEGIKNEEILIVMSLINGYVLERNKSKGVAMWVVAIALAVGSAALQ